MGATPALRLKRFRDLRPRRNGRLGPREAAEPRSD